MDSQNEHKFTIFFNLYLNQNKWHKSGNKYPDNRHFGRFINGISVPITQDTGFFIKHPYNYRVLGLKNFIHTNIPYNDLGDHHLYTVYKAGVTDDIYPIKIENEKNDVVSTVYLCVGSKYFPLLSDNRKYMIKYLESFDKNMIIGMNKDTKKFKSLSYGTNTQFNKLSIFNLLRDYDKIIIAFHNLVSNPDTHLMKKYSQYHSLKNIDNKSFKIDVIHPGQYRTSFIRINTYDTENNRWVKHISLKIIDLANKSISQIRQKTYWSYSLLQRCLHKLFTVRDYLIYINQNTFLNNVSYHINSLPINLCRLSRYNYIYHEYIRLFINKLNVNYYIHRKYVYSVKPTYDIYELWTFVKVLKYFISKGFKINELKYKNCDIDLLDFIKHGFLKGYNFYLINNKKKILLDVVYNEAIDVNKGLPLCILNPRISSLTKLKHAQCKQINYDNNLDYKYRLHDKPDVRVDVLNIGNSTKRNEYCGSFFLDAKCRSQNNINHEARDICQLLYYKNNVRYTNHLYYEYRNYLGIMNISPVHDVYILFPDTFNKYDTYNIPGIKYITLLPNGQYKNTKLKLMSSVYKCIHVKKVYRFELHNAKLGKRHVFYK